MSQRFERPFRLEPDGRMIVSANRVPVCAAVNADVGRMVVAALNDTDECDVCGGAVVMESSTTIRCALCGNAMTIGGPHAPE
jgi:hypothetical protein